MTNRSASSRTVAVRLSDIPIVIRRRRGRRVYEDAVADRDLRLAVAIDSAIERPSDTVYWVPGDAYERVMGNGRN